VYEQLESDYRRSLRTASAAASAAANDDDEDDEKQIVSAASPSKSSRADPYAEREEKMDRLRRKKEAEKQLEVQSLCAFIFIVQLSSA
jgi:hypothetical protein